MIEATAKAVAADLGLPWELLTLRERARQYVSRPGVLDAWKEHDRSRGLPFPHQAYIRKELRKELLRCGTEIRKELLRRGKERTASSPSEETVREVYEAYSRDEWKNLVTKLDRADLEPLLSYLHRNKDELTLTPKDWMKYGGVYTAAGTRRMVLRFRQGNWVATPISDPLWAAVWWEMSRRRTRQGLPRPSKRRSWMEMASDRAVAESLGYDPDTMHGKVVKWRKRMKEVSREEFVAKFGGDWTDYLTWVYNPRLHSKIQRGRKRRGE